MDDHSEPQWTERREYAVPTYQSPHTSAWYHFLHGNVPGHQIDFMYRPEVPQGPLTRQHFSHLARLMKYIEPHTNSKYAFAVGNLSRDDTQYEPGRGGLALIFGFRLRGATDHAGRRDPPFAHAIATADRAMDYGALFSASMGLFQRLFGQRRDDDGPSITLYREYVRCAAESPELIVDALRAYTAGFRDLPRPGPSSMALRWLTDGAPQPKRISIVYPDNAPFSVLAETSARIAAMLFVSDIRWTAITSGRESDVPNGVTVRLVAQRDASTVEHGGGSVMNIDEVPLDEGDIAQRLFNARSAVTHAPVQGGGWRERYGGSRGPQSRPPPAPPSDKGYGGGPETPHGSPASARARYGSAGAEERAPERVAPARMDDDPTRPWTSLPTNASEAPPEPPRAFSESARFSPAAIRASLGPPEYSPPPPPVASAPPQSPQPPLQSPPPPQSQPQAVQKAQAVLKAQAVVAPPSSPKALVPTIAKPRSERAGQAAGALSAEASHPPVIANPLKSAAPAREAIRANADRPEASDLEADVRPASRSRRNVYLGVLAGVSALAAIAYFGFMSSPPKPTGDIANPSKSAPPPTAATNSRPDPAPVNTAAPPPATTGKSPPPSRPSTPLQIIEEEPAPPEPKRKPAKPSPSPTTPKRKPPTTSALGEEILF